MTLEQTIHLAYDLGIEVVMAKTMADMKKPGLHLLEPTPDQIATALTRAIQENIPIIIVHSKVTWIYRPRN